MKKISDIMEGFAKRTFLGRKMNERRIIEAWQNTVGDKLRRHAKPGGLVNGTLFVNVDNSVTIFDSITEREKIADRINGALGERMIKKIILKIGSIE